MRFEFLEPGQIAELDLVDRELEVRVTGYSPADDELGWAPAYLCDMVHRATGKSMGRIGLRIGESEMLTHYAGHIGYEVDPEYRGNRYAARSVRLLLRLATRHGLRTLWITCNPDNIASARSCELAGGIYVETVDLPQDTDMYREGERQKRRYRFDL